MMSKNEYYLVVRNRRGKDFKIVSLDGIEGNPKSLAAIDLYTTSFQTEAEFIMELFDKKIIDQFDVDVFIAKRSNRDLSFFEVLYGKDNSYIEKLRSIARAKQQDKMNLEVANVDSILDEFCRKVYFDDDFSDMVICELTDIYKKFSDYFKRNFASLQAMCGVKYFDGSWARKSYPLVRNIVESFTRFGKFYMGCFHHFVDEDNYYDYNNRERKRISDKLLRETEHDFFAGQLSLFDYCDMQEETIEDKMAEVLDMIQNLPREAIKCENDEVVFNDEVFVYYESPLYKERLENFLKPIGRILYHYLYEEKDLGRIGIQLKEDSKLLDNMYSFCKLYDKCYEDDEQFRRLHGMLGDGDGKVFKKQENN